MQEREQEQVRERVRVQEREREPEREREQVQERARVPVRDAQVREREYKQAVREVREAQDRVRTAIRNLKLLLPPKKVTINLSPADLRKEGTGFDLAIAAAVLTAYGYVSPRYTESMIFLGELGLDGRVKGIPGVLTMVSWAKEQGYALVFLPRENQVRNLVKRDRNAQNRKENG